jgi:hypothetical protein
MGAAMALEMKMINGQPTMFRDGKGNHFERTRIDALSSFVTTLARLRRSLKAMGFPGNLIQ